MKISIQIIINSNDTEPITEEIVLIERESFKSDSLGLRLDESKELLAQVQKSIINQQVN